METKKISLHTHSTFCDGHNSAEEMILSAIEKGFSTIGFSSHCFHPLNPEFYTNHDTLWHIPSDTIDDYVKEINRLKEKYAEKIQVLLGFEGDYLDLKGTGKATPDKKAYSCFNPDYLIGSVHFISTDKGFFSVDNKAEIVEKDLIRLYTNSKTDKPDGKAAVCDYFEAERQMLKTCNFDIIGHPDLIKLRNATLHFFDENETWYKDELKLTAKEIAKAGVIAEINTGAIARGLLDDIYPSAQFLEYLKEYNVPVCVNSDAHRTEHLDAAFEKAYAAAKKTGYAELTYPAKNGLIHIPL